MEEGSFLLWFDSCELIYSVALGSIKYRLSISNPEQILSSPFKIETKFLLNKVEYLLHAKQEIEIKFLLILGT